MVPAAVSGDFRDAAGILCHNQASHALRRRRTTSDREAAPDAPELSPTRKGWEQHQKYRERRRCDTTSLNTPAFGRTYVLPLSFSTNFNAAELMQNRNPVGSGPSSNTCPKCASHLLQIASVRTIP
jgi:hypothetical protein